MLRALDELKLLFDSWRCSLFCLYVVLVLVLSLTLLELEFCMALPMTPPVLDVKVIVAGDDDWLPQPPKVVSDKSKESGEDSTIKALR
ncbi:hypothetical protein Bca4012_092715 [Brassica carinata]|uniref:Uncharacterized protein n=1 Tax=Brassica carinata TaxID=52824 RepID=A0A8X7PS44_BRACI|nr:hypothetical protein Bca52824_075026 [Brassica carinata]